MDESYEDREQFWTLRDRPRDETELLLPMRQDFKDYYLRVGEALETLQSIENRSMSDILEDVLTAAYDVVRVKVNNPRYESGSLDLDGGVALFSNVRKLLTSAARSAYDPRPQFVAGMPSEVADYLSRVRLGQTEPGSYIVNVLSPTTSGLEPGQLFSTEPYEHGGPFEDQVVYTLSRALDAVDNATAQAVRDPQLTSFQEAVPIGVSANLCEALSQIGKTGENTDVEVDMRWALSRGTEVEPVQTFRFSAAVIPVIEEAGRLLRSTPSRGQLIEGYVTRLAREKRLGDEGTITITALIDDKLRRITVDLDPASYQVAVRAHEEDRRVVCYGRLERRGKSFYLRNPRGLEMIDDTEEGEEDYL
ncbi:MAG: hypothetical protein ACFB50_11870 [Rubrobacteraceae bacterium]